MLLALTVIDFIALGLIISHALIMKNYQMFPAILYILTGDSMAGLSTSPLQHSTPGVITISLTASNNASVQQSYSAPAAHIYMLVLSTTLLLVMLHVCRFIKWILFGQLRIIEYEHLYEWAWMSASECFLAMTIFRDELDAKFVICFAGLLAIKAFHWITKDRVDFMEQSATPLEQDFFIRISVALGLLILINVYCIMKTVEYSLQYGASMNLLFANEFMLLIISWTSTCIRFAFNIKEHRDGHPWEEKSQNLLYIDVFLDFIRLMTYSFFFAIVFSYYGLPLHLIRELYLTASSFTRRMTELLRYRQAVIHLDRTYPTLEARDLESMIERTCIVCREEISVNAGTGNTDKAKKLPCGHVFHFKCLRSWLERQQACPTCRRPLLTSDRVRQPDVQVIDPMQQLRQAGQNLFQQFRAHVQQQQQQQQQQRQQEVAPPQPPPRTPDTSNHGYPGSADTRQQVTESQSTSRIQSLHSSIDTLQKQLTELQAKLNSHTQQNGGTVDSPNTENINQNRETGEKDVIDERGQRSMSNVQEALRKRYMGSTSKDIEDEDKPEQK